MCLNPISEIFFDKKKVFLWLFNSIGISDKGLFWGRQPLTALRGHLMNLLGPFLALKKEKNVGLAS